MIEGKILILLLCIFFISFPAIHPARILITNCSDFQGKSDLNASYVLTNDIDCTDRQVNNLGNFDSFFYGSLDGQGFSITNLSISSTNTSYIGIFGYGMGCVVKNLSLINFNLSVTASSMGILFGRCVDCTITDITLNTSSPVISNLISQKSSSFDIGGLVGSCTGCEISQVYLQNTIIDASRKVGSIVGLATSCNITNVYNLGFSLNPETIFVRGSGDVGGLIGQSQDSFTTNSGISNGIIVSVVDSCGGLVGLCGDCILISRCYVKSSVSIQGLNKTGGFLGFVQPSSKNLTVENSYSKAKVVGFADVGGFFGVLDIFSSFARSNVINSYSSGSVTGTLNVASSIGNIKSVNTCSFNNAFYNNQTNNLPAIANGSCFDNTSPKGLNCTDLFNTVSTSFDQINTWSGDNLKIEKPFTNGICSCVTGCPNLNTLTGCGVYNVPNCSFCSPNTLSVDVSLFEVSCKLFVPQGWSWVFRNRNQSSVIINNTNVTLNGTIFIDGNVTILSNSTLFLNYLGNLNSSGVVLTGCLNVSGNVVININQRPNVSEFSLLLFQYNCSSQTDFSASQLKVVSKYNKNSCDSRKEMLNNQQNSLSVSLGFEFNKNCDKTALIVGLSVGIPVLLVLVVVVSIFLMRVYSKHQSQQFAQKPPETNKTDEFVSNDSFSEKTKWNEFNKKDVEMN